MTNSTTVPYKLSSIAHRVSSSVHRIHRIPSRSYLHRIAFASHRICIHRIVLLCNHLPQTLPSHSNRFLSHGVSYPSKAPVRPSTSQPSLARPTGWAHTQPGPTTDRTLPPFPLRPPSLLLLSPLSLFFVVFSFSRQSTPFDSLGTLGHSTDHRIDSCCPGTKGILAPWPTRTLAPLQSHLAPGNTSTEMKTATWATHTRPCACVKPSSSVPTSPLLLLQGD